MPIPIPVELDRCAPAAAGGFLSESCPLPAGWDRGISFQDTSCLVPTVMGECPTCPSPGLKDAESAGTETFRPVSLITAFECSTFGGIDVAQVASANLDETASWALARELLTGEAARRDANPNVQGRIDNPSLQEDATVLSLTIVDPVDALGCLEQAIADTTGGRRGYVLIGPQIALALAERSVLFGQPGSLTTVSGTRVIVDGGFDGRAPLLDSPGDESPGECVPWNSGGAPNFGDPLFMYGTASVWAGVGRANPRNDVNRANNTATAREERVALTAFTPCATFAVSTGVLKAC